MIVTASRTLLLVLWIIVIAACGSEAADEAEVLISITDDVIVPSYEALEADTATLSDAVITLCAAQSDTALTSAQRAWRDARKAWAYSEASGFGPIQQRRSVRLIAWPVVQPERIDELLASNSSITAEMVRDQISSTQRGLGAMEYVLFAEDLRAALAADPGRCAYLRALAEVISVETAAILNVWQVAHGGSLTPYKDFLTGRSANSLITSEAVAEVIRTSVFLIRTIVDMRLAGALGLRGDADPSAIPGGVARDALADLRNQVLGMHDVYEGVEGGYGISDLIVPLSTDTDDRMRARFEASLSAIDAVDGSLREAAAERSQQMLAVYEELMALQNTLSTEVVSLLGISVGFSDTDGDSLR